MDFWNWPYDKAVDVRTLLWGFGLGAMILYAGVCRFLIVAPSPWLRRLILAIGLVLFLVSVPAGLLGVGLAVDAFATHAFGSKETFFARRWVGAAMLGVVTPIVLGMTLRWDWREHRDGLRCEIDG